MPIYEYDCEHCGIIEVLQKINDAPLANCPNCEEQGENSPVKRRVSLSAFHLKGSGWYKTDYAAKTNGNGASGNVAKSSDEGSGSGTPSKEGSADSKGAGSPSDGKGDAPAKSASATTEKTSAGKSEGSSKGGSAA